MIHNYNIHNHTQYFNQFAIYNYKDHGSFVGLMKIRLPLSRDVIAQEDRGLLVCGLDDNAVSLLRDVVSFFIGAVKLADLKIANWPPKDQI